MIPRTSGYVDLDPEVRRPEAEGPDSGEPRRPRGGGGGGEERRAGRRSDVIDEVMDAVDRSDERRTGRPVGREGGRAPPAPRAARGEPQVLLGHVGMTTRMMVDAFDGDGFDGDDGGGVMMRG